MELGLEAMDLDGLLRSLEAGQSRNAGEAHAPEAGEGLDGLD